MPFNPAYYLSRGLGLVAFQGGGGYLVDDFGNAVRLTPSLLAQWSSYLAYQGDFYWGAR